jgi:hypothetical protein
VTGVQTCALPISINYFSIVVDMSETTGVTFEKVFAVLKKNDRTIIHDK